MGTHLSELIKRHANELFSRQDAKNFIDRVTQESPKLVEDVVPKLLTLAVVQRVLQNLLRERVSIRDAVAIMEALGEAAGMTKNVVLLTEFVRQALRRTLVKPFLSHSGELPVFFVEPGLEKAIESAIDHGEHNSIVGIKPELARDIVTRMRTRLERTTASAVAVTTSGARHFLRQIVESALPNLTILSHNEIPSEVRVRSLGVLE
jgi:flagellar biosynthesis protein FlhA